MTSYAFYHEDQHQKMFDDIKLEFKPCVVLIVKMIRCRNITVSSFYDYCDTPDPQFRIRCPTLPNPKEYATLYMKPNVITCEINETFKFVIPENMETAEQIPVEIELFDLDYIFHDFLGKKSFDAQNDLKLGETISKTLDFDLHGELELEISKIQRDSPDFRFSLGLNPEEKAFRKKRLPYVCEAMKKLIGNDQAPKNAGETPVVSVACSGGGYRAAVSMCGAMEAFNDTGLLDMFTYLTGLSGSAWYLISAYGRKGITAENQKQFHEELRSRFQENALLDMVNPLTIMAYEGYIMKGKHKYQQPHSFVDYFPGYLMGKKMLGEDNMGIKLSDVKSYVDDGKVPLPTITSLHVKGTVKASTFHAHFEESPYEAGFPEFGIGLFPETDGSTWEGGFLACKRPEYPIHFCHGRTGCAFSILLQAFLQNGSEDSTDTRKYLEQERLKGKKAKENKIIEVESDEEDDTEDEDDDDKDDANEPPVETKKTTSFISTALRNAMRATTFFTDRNAYIGRTGKILNCARGLDCMKRFLMNPLFKEETASAQKTEVIKTLGVRKTTRLISKAKEAISFVDAGILLNVPTNIALRPQKEVDLLLVLDFSSYESDDKFDYTSVLLSAAAHAWRSGLQFPEVDFEKVSNLPPKDLFVFPSDNDDCPTVMWFTLSNTIFKNLSNYTPRSKERPVDGKKFNDFPVFSEGNAYSTFNFQYDNLAFDQLRELMYYTVTSHVQEIESALIEAVARKKRRLAKPT